MNTRLVAAAAAFLVFTTYSMALVFQDGYTGFIHLALAEPWGMQMLLDLTIALVLFSVVLVRDARSLGIAPWPYLVAILFLGSIGALAYVVHREAKVRRRPRAASSSMA